MVKVINSINIYIDHQSQLSYEQFIPVRLRLYKVYGTLIFISSNNLQDDNISDLIKFNAIN